MCTPLRLWYNMDRGDYMGLFDKLFDVNRDGKASRMEKGMAFAFAMMAEEERKKKEEEEQFFAESERTLREIEALEEMEKNEALLRELESMLDDFE